MKLTLPPLNRLVAFAGPYIALGSGALASYLVVHVQVLGSLGLGQDGLAHAIAYGATGAVGALIPHLGMEKWLDGHQQFTDQVLHIVSLLDPGAQKQIATLLPGVNGDLLKALEAALPVPGSTLTAAKDGVSEDQSGDIEQPNSLINTAAPDLDDLPDPALIGDDRVHSPGGIPAPHTSAEAPALAPDGGVA